MEVSVLRKNTNRGKPLNIIVVNNKYRALSQESLTLRGGQKNGILSR